MLTPTQSLAYGHLITLLAAIQDEEAIRQLDSSKTES